MLQDSTNSWKTFSASCWLRKHFPCKKLSLQNGDFSASHRFAEHTQMQWFCWDSDSCSGSVQQQTTSDLFFGTSLALGCGFPGGSEVKASACNVGEPGSIPGSGRFPWRRKWQPTPVLLPGESHGGRSLVGCSPWGLKE